MNEGNRELCRGVGVSFETIAVTEPDVRGRQAIVERGKAKACVIFEP